MLPTFQISTSITSNMKVIKMICRVDFDVQIHNHFTWHAQTFRLMLFDLNLKQKKTMSINIKAHRDEYNLWIHNTDDPVNVSLLPRDSSSISEYDHDHQKWIYHIFFLILFLTDHFSLLCIESLFLMEQIYQLSSK